MLAKGDLVKIPANSCLTQTHSELHMIDKYIYLEKPTLGIFIKYIDEKGLVYIKNNYWMIELGDIRHAGIKNAS